MFLTAKSAVKGTTLQLGSDNARLLEEIHQLRIQVLELQVQLRTLKQHPEGRGGNGVAPLHLVAANG